MWNARSKLWTLGVVLLVAVGCEAAAEDGADDGSACRASCEAQAAGEGCESAFSSVCIEACEQHLLGPCAELAQQALSCQGSQRWSCASDIDTPRAAEDGACRDLENAWARCVNEEINAPNLGEPLSDAPEGPATACFGLACPTECDDELFFSSTSCRDAAVTASPLCAQRDGNYCLSLDGEDSRFAVLCSDGDATVHACQSCGTDFGFVAHCDA